MGNRPTRAMQRSPSRRGPQPRCWRVRFRRRRSRRRRDGSFGPVRGRRVTGGHDPRLLPHVGQQLIEAGQGPTALELGDHIGRPRQGIDALHMARSKDGVLLAPGLPLVVGQPLVFAGRLDAVDLLEVGEHDGPARVTALCRLLELAPDVHPAAHPASQGDEGLATAIVAQHRLVACVAVALQISLEVREQRRRLGRLPVRRVAEGHEPHRRAHETPEMAALDAIRVGAIEHP